MQTIEFNSYLGSVNDLFPCSTCLVIGIGSGSYINTLEALDFKDVILVDADEHQLEKMHKIHSVPSSYVVKNILVYKDEANILFYIATNPTVNCFKTIDTYKPLMPNISLLETKELQSYTLATFLQDFKGKEVNWLIIDTFTALEILENSKNSLEKLEVIVCKILSDTRETLQVFMLENGFKLVKHFKENNPKMGVAVYVKDYSVKNAKSEMQKSALAKQLQAEQEIVNSLKEGTVKEIQTLKVQKTELEQKVTSYQDEQKIFQNREKEFVAKIESQKSQFEKQLREVQDRIEKIKITSEEEKQAAVKATRELEVKKTELEKNITSYQNEKEVFQNKEKEFVVKLETQKSQFEKQLKEIQDTLERLQATSEEEKKKLEIQKADLNQKVKSFQEKLELFESKEGKSEKSIEQIKEVLQKELNTHKENREISFKKIESQLGVMQKKLAKHIDTSGTNSAKQIESFISIQNYLRHGLQPFDFHGWPISPDITLFMIAKIEQNDYDLIIEFGSGTSTVVFANIIKNQKKKNREKKLKKVVSFEHNEVYFQKTKALLKEHSVNKYSDLVLAPLVEYMYEENKYMYYDCKPKLAELNKSSNIENILILIDGPPEATGPLARFPVLAHLLDNLSVRKMDLVLDDFRRDDEQAISKMWEEMLKEKNISFKSESVPSEKGLYFCQINKK